MTNMVLEIKNCNKIFKKDKKEIIALQNINYKFKTKTFYAIMGPSGSGKSTLINLICGLERLSSGDILYYGKKVTNDKDYSNLRNKKIGLIYQSFLLNENLTALENVYLPLTLNKGKKNVYINRSKKILESLGLGNRLNHYPRELSGGEQQRVAIARALINNPDIILADEPTGNLDKKNEEYVFNKLKELSENGKCVIAVSHNKSILKYADVSLKIEGGILYEK